jgi:dihydroneopterin aldolase
VYLLEVLIEELAGFVLLALDLLAAVEIHIVLPAVPASHNNTN